MQQLQLQSRRIVSLSLLLILAFTSAYVIDLYTQNPKASENPDFSYASPESQGISNESVAELTEIVQSYLDGEEIVGTELVVIKNRMIVLHEVFGWKDREGEIPMEKNSVFNIRSMTKTITGAAIQTLIDDGRLSLDSRAAEFIPGFDNEASRNITVGQLLSHMSGLPLSLMLSTDDFETLFLLANETGARGPQFEPGSKFWYSDAGTEVLGVIVEVETGQPVDAYVTENILEPLGMNGSFYYHAGTLNDTRKDRIPSLYVGGIGEWLKIWSSEEPLYPFAFGSQSLYCTPVDYARFLAMWMEEGQVGGSQLLSAEAVDRTLTPVTKMSNLGSDAPYPTGFYGLEAYYGQMATLFANATSTEPEVEVIGHSGSDGTYAWAWPDEDLIILYFTQSRGSTSGIKLESRIDELLIHPELQEINAAMRKEHAEYLGEYTANFGPFKNAAFTVTVQNGRLALDIPNQVVYELDDPDEGGLRRFMTSNEVAISFTLDDRGNVTSLLLHQAGYVFDLPKGSPTQAEVYPEDMERYVGTYETEDPNVTMGVVIVEGRLALDIPGQPAALELYPPDENGIWNMRVNPAVAISFNESEDGDILSLNLYLPDGTILTRLRIRDT